MTSGSLLHPLRLALMLAGFVLMTLAATSAPALADLRVCNQSTNQVSIALGYRAEKGWQSEGWWVAPPDNCVTIYRGNLEARRYYYVYAADDVSGGAWDGSV